MIKISFKNSNARWKVRNWWLKILNFMISLETKFHNIFIWSPLHFIKISYIKPLDFIEARLGGKVPIIVNIFIEYYFEGHLGNYVGKKPVASRWNIEVLFVTNRVMLWWGRGYIELCRKNVLRKRNNDRKKNAEASI